MLSQLLLKETCYGAFGYSRTIRLVLFQEWFPPGRVRLYLDIKLAFPVERKRRAGVSAVRDGCYKLKQKDEVVLLGGERAEVVVNDRTLFRIFIKERNQWVSYMKIQEIKQLVSCLESVYAFSFFVQKMCSSMISRRIVSLMGTAALA